MIVFDPRISPPRYPACASDEPQDRGAQMGQTDQEAGPTNGGDMMRGDYGMMSGGYRMGPGDDAPWHVGPMGCQAPAG
jgi:hypothetical protein